MKNNKTIFPQVTSRKSFRKGAASILTLAMLAIPTGAALASDAAPVVAIPISAEIQPTDGVSNISAQKAAFFLSSTGKITSITDYTPVEGAKFVTLTGENDAITNFIVKPDTYAWDEAKLVEGEVFTFFYDARKPTILIFPPQLGAVAYVKGEGKLMTFDRFEPYDNTLVSAEGSIKITSTDQATIVGTDGKKFEGELANRDLLIKYNEVLESYPAQVSPTQIVVFPEQEESVIEVPDDLEEPMEIIDDMFKITKDTHFFAGDKQIDAGAAFNNDKGIAMVPLRSIAEALGYTVTWNKAEQTIRINVGTAVTVGKDYYVYGRTAPITLGTAPVVQKGITYVPVSFFPKVIRHSFTQTDNNIVFKTN